MLAAIFSPCLLSIRVSTPCDDTRPLAEPFDSQIFSPLLYQLTQLGKTSPGVSHSMLWSRLKRLADMLAPWDGKESVFMGLSLCFSYQFDNRRFGSRPKKSNLRLSEISLELRFDGQETYEPCAKATSWPRMWFRIIKLCLCAVFFQPNNFSLSAFQTVAFLHLGF